MQVDEGGGQAEGEAAAIADQEGGSGDLADDQTQAVQRLRTGPREGIAERARADEGAVGKVGAVVMVIPISIVDNECIATVCCRCQSL